MTRQFDIYRTPLRGKEQRPFVVVLQSHRIETQTRVCAPLVAEKFIVDAGRLTPAFTIDGQRCHLDPTDLAAIPIRLLRNPITNLEAERDRFIAAIDLVFTGI
jgi:toxin CcdB